MSIPNPRHQPPLFLLCFLLFSTSTSAAAAAAAANEAAILYSWLHTASPPPSDLSTWNPLDPTPCNWTSISCSPQTSSVSTITIQSISLHLPLPPNLSLLTSLTSLTISNSNLTGPIPPSLSHLTSLALLDLSSNSLSGPIPPSLSALKNLHTLILNSNRLSGQIPPELTSCLSLRNLIVFDNSLAGPLPPALPPSLEVIRAGGNNNIVGIIPAEYGYVTNLTVLGLADTRVLGSLPASLGKLKKLQTLSIYTTLLSGAIPAELGDCAELVSVYLYENSLSGPIPRELGKLRKLERLLLWQNSLAGVIPEEIGNCTSLVSVDLSLNSISGSLPESIGRLSRLQEFMISNNNVSGSIPSVLLNASSLVQLQLDANQFSGVIPPEIGRLSRLSVFFAWQNKLEGSIPSSLAKCSSLQALDLSHNLLTGGVPPGLFLLRNLTKLLLISNDISGGIPPEIGNCTSLVRLRLGRNRIAGEIPKEIGMLRNVNFLDLSSNRLSGLVPDEIGSCTELQMLDLSRNSLVGSLPDSLSSLYSLEVFDGSGNQFEGQIHAGFGRLVLLSKLILRGNRLSGSIPSSLGFCSSLQLLDLSNNMLSGDIPVELCKIEALEIALNLSWNGLIGPIPDQISALNKLSILDLSHNELSGDLGPLAKLDNLISLNISFNNFTGYLPDTKIFRQLPQADLAGNEGLCSLQRDSCFLSNVDEDIGHGEIGKMRTKTLKIAILVLITMAIAMVIMGIFVVIRGRRTMKGDDESELGDSWPWHFTPFQKLNFSVDMVLRCLVDSNVIGKGFSGVVYRAEMDNGEVIAVKKLWPNATNGRHGYVDRDDYKSSVRDSFSAEIKTLGSIRHKNIVRFLGCCWNRHTRLLMYDYMPNGSLGSLLHERPGSTLEWEPRYRILSGAADGLAYLHHDCVPPIVHRDIKANNILIGLEFEPYIADFGLAKVVENRDFARSSKTIAGSFGYIAPEYGYTTKITEKSDVYSFGVVMLEVLTGKQPIDPTIPEGLHVVDWVRKKKGCVEVLDPIMLGRPESEIEEMIQTLGIALLCANSSPDERPTMRDVAAMLKEIKHEREEFAKVDVLLKQSPKAKAENRTPPRSGEPDIGVQATSSSSRPGMEGLMYPKSNNTSFTGSSLFYSSTSSA